MKKIIRLTESELVKMVKKIINEQPSEPKYKVGQTFNVLRDKDNQRYTITLMKVGSNWVSGKVVGPGKYGGNDLRNGIELELNLEPDGFSGNMELGKFKII
jgi:hypothetical protein